MDHSQLCYLIQETLENLRISSKIVKEWLYDHFSCTTYRELPEPRLQYMLDYLRYTKCIKSFSGPTNKQLQAFYGEDYI